MKTVGCLVFLPKTYNVCKSVFCYFVLIRELSYTCNLKFLKSWFYKFSEQLNKNLFILFWVNSSLRFRVYLKIMLYVSSLVHFSSSDIIYTELLLNQVFLYRFKLHLSFIISRASLDASTIPPNEEHLLKVLEERDTGQRHTHIRCHNRCAYIPSWVHLPFRFPFLIA